MTSRTKLIAGNWKMNGRRADGIALARAASPSGRGPRRKPHACDLLVCPPGNPARDGMRGARRQRNRLGGQDCHAAPTGAYTG